MRARTNREVYSIVFESFPRFKTNARLKFFIIFSSIINFLSPLTLAIQGESKKTDAFHIQICHNLL